MLSALIEWVKGMLTKKGCGGINTISRETGSFPPSSILSRHEYLTPSFALGTTPKIVSFDSYITLYRDIFTNIFFYVASLRRCVRHSLCFYCDRHIVSTHLDFIGNPMTSPVAVTLSGVSDKVYSTPLYT